MKKIVRLTESDLYRIVKRVISEQVPQNNKVPTQGGPEKKPTPAPKTFKDYKWYANQIKKIFSDLMSVMNCDTTKNCADLFLFDPNFKNNPQQVANLNLYAKKMGQLISPEAPENEQIKLGKAYFTGVGTSGHKMDRTTSPMNLIKNYNDNGSAGIAKQLLIAQIEKNKTVEVKS